MQCKCTVECKVFEFIATNDIDGSLWLTVLVVKYFLKVISVRIGNSGMGSYEMGAQKTGRGVCIFCLSIMWACILIIFHSSDMSFDYHPCSLEKKDFSLIVVRPWK